MAEKELKVGDATILVGDCLGVLKTLPSESIQCVITSPPYFGLRSYLKDGHDSKGLELGAEKTPQEYVQNLVKVFREVRRVLHPSGVVWLNLGDSYSGGGGNDYRPEGYVSKQDTNKGSMHVVPRYRGIPAGNLLGVPWRVAFALQDARQESSKHHGHDPKLHQHQKRVKLMSWCVRLCCPEKGVVLDPFMGSGSTGVACLQTTRGFIGIEQDQECAVRAGKRLARRGRCGLGGSDGPTGFGF